MITHGVTKQLSSVGVVETIWHSKLAAEIVKQSNEGVDCTSSTHRGLSLETGSTAPLLACHAVWMRKDRKPAKSSYFEVRIGEIVAGYERNTNVVGGR